MRISCQLFDANSRLLRVHRRERRIASRMTSRATRFEIRVLVVHLVARFKMGRQCNSRRNFETRLRSALFGEQLFLGGVNGDMATRRLASRTNIARDIEFRAAMLGMAIACNQP